MGIYLGDGEMIDPAPNGGVQTRPVDMDESIDGGRLCYAAQAAAR